MRASGFVLIAAAWLAACTAGPAASQQLTFDHREARIADVRLDREGIHWDLEVRDLCGATVRRYEVVVECAPWRPLREDDVDRDLAFKGEVELPDGKTAKATKRGGSMGGEHVVLMGLLLTDEAVESTPDWPLRHEDDHPGTWTIPAEDLGGVLLRWSRPEDALETWPIQIKASSRQAPIQWENGRSLIGSNLDAADIDGQAAHWRCATLSQLVISGRPLDEAVSLEAWIADVRSTEPVCPDASAWLLEQTCGRASRLAADLEAATTPEQRRDLAGNCAAVVGACPATYGDVVTAAVDRVLAGDVQLGELERLQALIEDFGPVMGATWVGRAWTETTIVANRLLDALFAAGDLEAVGGFAARHGPFLGEEWRAAVDERLAWIEARASFELVELPDNRVTFMDVHPSPGEERVVHSGGTTTEGTLSVYTGDGTPLCSFETYRAHIHAVDVDGDGLAELFVHERDRRRPRDHVYSVVRVQEPAPLVLWEGRYEGGNPRIPTRAMFVVRESGGLGLLFSAPETNPACAGRTCTDDELFDGARWRTSYYAVDAGTGTFAPAPLTAETESIRRADGREVRHGGFHEGYRSGVWTLFHDNGNKAVEGIYMAGRRHGTWLAWHPGGQRSAQATFSDGELTGPIEYFNELGERLDEASFQRLYGAGDPFEIPSVSELVLP